MTARRAILRKPVDRIGYGGYLKLALDFPEFVDYIESVCNEFRELYENAKGTTALLRQDRGCAEQLGKPAAGAATWCTMRCIKSRTTAMPRH